MADPDSDGFARRVTRVGALAEPVRRALYRYVAAQPEPVSRDQAADGVEVPRHTAKFHLERLVEEGLLNTEYRRLSGRTGPGAGRPAKLYRRANDELSVSLPDRRYDLAGSVLADAIELSLSDGVPLPHAVPAAAAAAGARVADQAAPPDRRKSQLRQLGSVLEQAGYEPRIDDTGMTLTNCPFDRLASVHAELVCGMNLALVDAVAERLGCTEVVAELDPAPPNCCVRVRTEPR
jgi:predicted ArsR family transcriptional regulator